MIAGLKFNNGLYKWGENFSMEKKHFCRQFHEQMLKLMPENDTLVGIDISPDGNIAEITVRSKDLDLEQANEVAMTLFFEQPEKGKYGYSSTDLNGSMNIRKYEDGTMADNFREETSDDISKSFYELLKKWGLNPVEICINRQWHDTYHEEVMEIYKKEINDWWNKLSFVEKRKIYENQTKNTQ